MTVSRSRPRAQHVVVGAGAPAACRQPEGRRPVVRPAAPRRPVRVFAQCQQPDTDAYEPAPSIDSDTQRLLLLPWISTAR